MTGYTTPEKIRKILGLEIEEASDTLLTDFITDATNVIISRLTVKVLDETPRKGTCDGTNKEFYPENSFIADINGDTIIDKSDIHVYAWTNLSDESTKVEVTVNSLNPLTGRIVLVSAPSSDKYVTITYSYYRNQMDFNLADLAARYYAAKLWVERELLLVPETYKVGRLTMKNRPVWQDLNRNFERIMHLLLSCPMDKVIYEKIVAYARNKTLEEELEGTENKVEIPEDIC